MRRNVVHARSSHLVVRRLQGRLALLLVPVVCIGTWLLTAAAFATPPDYKSLKRDQDTGHNPAADELMRIWIVYVEQGDGMLIQLPTRFNYDPDPQDGDPTRSERLDILIDGGASPVSEAWRMQQFVENVYPSGSAIIEYAVITHHDRDHIEGLIELLDADTFGVETIYHNGLASYRGGARFQGVPDIPETTDDANADRAILKSSHSNVTRCLGILDSDGEHFLPEYLIDSLAELRAAQEAGKLQGDYEDLATAILTRADPIPVGAFRRAHTGADFINENEAQHPRGVSLDGVEFEVLWPESELRHYGGNWSETINGNSVTFKLQYGDFEMLFTGDHNEISEEAFLMLYENAGRLPELACDVLKVPHHGSSHGIEKFFDAVAPVMSVASMGEQGFKSKQLNNNNRNWQHPSTQVIGWLGGAHRVYLTLAHEKRFRWDDLVTAEDHAALMEYDHVLVETDGTWFRFVEVPDVSTNVNDPPTMTKTRRGNGTRWIRAR